MNKRGVLLGRLGYLVVTFPLAVIWHVVLFEPFYRSIHYFSDDPNFALGFLTILIQGFVLSVGFGLVKFEGTSLLRGFKYALMMGLFFWTSHVLASAAKNPLSDTPMFYLGETFYLCMQFGIYGLIIGKAYGSESE